MFIDASAIVAILIGERDADALLERIEQGVGPRFVSPLVRFEAAVTLARAKSGKQRPPAGLIRDARILVDAFIDEVGATEIAISGTIGDRAIEAAATYGKVVGHPADLNFGDCFAYACAKEHKVGLLYKGNDFARTDLA
jgi:ribonuclease VapC